MYTIDTPQAIRYPATEAQINRLIKALAERIEDPRASLDAIKWVNEHRLSSSLASAKITEYEAKPKVRDAFSASESTEIPVGVYVVKGTIYKVYKTRNGFLATRTLTEDGFVYTGRKPLYSIKVSDRMTKEAAAAYGALYGTCVNCQATLTDDTSIAQGYGPVCAKYFA